MQPSHRWINDDEVLKTSFGEKDAWGLHSYRSATDILLVDPDNDPYVALSALVHEGIHSGQHAFTTYGLFVLASELHAFEQLLYDMGVARKRLDPDSGVPRMSVAATVSMNTDLRRLFYGIDVRGIGRDTSVSQLADHLRPSLLTVSSDMGVVSDFRVAGFEFSSQALVPACPKIGSIGARELLETSALAAQIAGFRQIPTIIRSHSRTYCGAQSLFLEVLRAWLPDFVPPMTAVPNGVPPLKNLLDFHCGVDLSSDRPESVQTVETSNVSRAKSIRVIQLCLAFCVAVHQALMIPLSSRPLAWHHLHPGWRFVRLLAVLENTLRGGGATIEQFLAHPPYFFEQAGVSIGLAGHGDYGSLLQWQGLQMRLKWSQDRVLARLFKSCRGMVQSLPWLSTVRVEDVPDLGWLKNDEKSRLGLDELLVTSALEARRLMQSDASVTYARRSGATYYCDVQRATASPVRSVDDCHRVLNALKRPLPLHEAIQTEFFHLLLNQANEIREREDVSLGGYFLDTIVDAKSPLAGECKTAVRELIEELNSFSKVLAG